MPRTSSSVKVITLSRRGFFVGSPPRRRPRAQPLGDHVDDSDRRLIVRRFISRLGSSIGNWLGRRTLPKFTEIPPVDESFDLILQLEALLGVVAVASVKSAVLDRKSTRLNSSHSGESRMPSSA